MLQVQSFRDLLREAGDRFGSQPFLIDDPLLRSPSYEKLACFANGVERELDSLRIPPGATVATLFHNCGLAASLFLAVIASRRILVPLNPLSSTAELDYILNRAACQAVLFDPTHARSTEFGERKRVPIQHHEEYFGRLVAAGQGASTPSASAAEPAFAGEIVFTSGSTGQPKGVVLSERNLLVDAASLAQVYDLRSTDRFLSVCPLFHNSGQVLTTLACALVGGSTAAVKSDVGMLNFWSYVDRYQPQWSLGMTSFLALLLASPGSPKQAQAMRGLLTGGSAIDGALVQAFESRFRIPVRTIYGLTETASISTCEWLDPRPRSLGSSGRPLPICEIRIDCEASADAPTNGSRTLQAGEILIKGEHVFDRYVGDPELTRRRKVDGWVRTGDIGYFDEHGNLFVIDRMDSMLIVGGENVYPAEVEKLCGHLPGAAQIVVSGIEHPIWGHQLILTYKPASGTKPSLEEWHRILSEHLSAAKIPQRYLSLEDLGLADFPRLQNGKLDRHALRILVREHLEPSR